MKNRNRNVILALLATTLMGPAPLYAAEGKDVAKNALLQDAQTEIGAAKTSDLTVPPAMLDPSGATTDMPNEPTMQQRAEMSAQITLADALKFSYQNNPSIRAARTELLATQERLPQAQAGWKPSADATADITNVNIETDGAGDSDNTEKNLGLALSQPVYRGGRTVSAIDSAKSAIMAQRAFLLATEQDILLQVVTAYMNVLRDQSLYDLAVNNKDVIDRQLEASRARFEVGDVTRTDVSQSEARLSGAEANRVRALGNLRASRAVFRQVTGMDVAGLQSPQNILPIPGTLNESVAMADQYNPLVLASEFLHSAAKEDIDTVFGELLPSVGLFANLDHSIDPSLGTLNDRTTRAVGISATIPLYEGGATRSRVRQAKSTASQRLIEVEEARDLARQRTVSSWEDLTAAKSEILSRKAQVEANRIARDGVHKEAELGTRTILNALDADQELLDSESALVTAQRNEVVAQYALATSLGLMTPEVLGFPELKRDYNDHIDEITGKVFSTSTRYGGDLAGSTKQ